MTKVGSRADSTRASGSAGVGASDAPPAQAASAATVTSPTTKNGRRAFTPRLAIADGTGGRPRRPHSSRSAASATIFSTRMGGTRSYPSIFRRWYPRPWVIERSTEAYL